MNLVTFGCSWVAGVGASYDIDNPDDLETYKTYCLDNEKTEKYAWRTLLSEKYKLKNINKSKGGSANQSQFRRATRLFSNRDFNPDDTIILWGITSYYRDELWFNGLKMYSSFSFGDSARDNSKKYGDFSPKKYFFDHFDEEESIKSLKSNIRHWQDYFTAKGFRHYWFDILNETNTIENHHLDFGQPGKKDLMSQLATVTGLETLNDSYHWSSWLIDCDRIKHLERVGMVNRHSFHPTRQGNQTICSLFDHHLKTILNV
tara:strand:- start:3673 stop:4452 length:780 start_codon:yes stop_codon:yes gene_type:complete